MVSDEYYIDILSAERLRKCYEIAPPRIKQYLKAEINYVSGKITSNDLVLELGCGYGRVLSVLASKAKKVFGIDTSLSSIMLGKELYGNITNCFFEQMNARNLDFPNKMFDIVICIQNGISAFHVDQKELITEAIRVTKPGGTILFSSYSEKFWDKRIEWFELQSQYGLIGKIDYNKTKNGDIVCKDGFTATTMNRKEFEILISDFMNIKFNYEEVDESSVFFEIIPIKF